MLTRLTWSAKDQADTVGKRLTLLCLHNLRLQFVISGFSDLGFSNYFFILKKKVIPIMDKLKNIILNFEILESFRG